MIFAGPRIAKLEKGKSSCVTAWLNITRYPVRGRGYPLSCPRAVADPGFPRGGGANPQGGGASLLFGQHFPKNCMKMKEFGPRGGCASLAPPP